MKEVTNKYGMTFKVGKRVTITKRFGGGYEALIDKVSDRYIWADGKRFSITTRNSVGSSVTSGYHFETVTNE